MLRLLYFSGYGLPDDIVYSNMMASVLEGRYPVIPDSHMSFSVRPFLLYSMAFSLKIFGRSEWAYIIPMLLSSLLGIMACYWMASRLFDRRVAILSSLVLILFPLDWVYATKISNDSLGSGLFWLGAAIAVAVSGVRVPKPLSILGGWWGGLLMGLMIAAKGTFFFPGGLLLLTLGYWYWVGRKLPANERNARALTAGSTALGWFCGWLFWAVFFYIKTGNPIANIVYETQFAQDNWVLNRDFWRECWFYPSLMFNPRQVYYRANPFGIFFILALVGASFGVFSKKESVRLVIFWFLALLLIFQFWPQQVFPRYISVFHLPRYLTVTAVPGAMLIGYSLLRLAKMSRGGAFLSVGIAIVYLLTSWKAVATETQYFNDSVRDARLLADYMRQYWKGPIAMPRSLSDYLYLVFDTRDLASRLIIEPEDVSELKPGTLVVTGGAHSIDLDPAYFQVGLPDKIPSDWMEVANVGGPLTRKRLTPMRFWMVTNSSHAKPEGQLSPQCAGAPWRFIDFVLPGHGSSRFRHQAKGKFWGAPRARTLSGGAIVAEEGNWVVDYQEFTVSGLKPGVDACLVERMGDPPNPLVVLWMVVHGATVSDRLVLNTIMRDERVNTRSMFIPGSYITGTSMVIREEIQNPPGFFASMRLEVYQRGARDRQHVRTIESRQ